MMAPFLVQHGALIYSPLNYGQLVQWGTQIYCSQFGGAMIPQYRAFCQVRLCLALPIAPVFPNSTFGNSPPHTQHPSYGAKFVAVSLWHRGTLPHYAGISLPPEVWKGHSNLAGTDNAVLQYITLYLPAAVHYNRRYINISKFTPYSKYGVGW